MFVLTIVFEALHLNIFVVFLQLFDFVRDSLLSQGLRPPARQRFAGTVQWKFLGRSVCRRALATLMGVGWSPRLQTMLTAAINGQRSAPLDQRYLTKPQGSTISSPTWAEVSSYLQSLYESAAESMPTDRGRECACDEADEMEGELNGVSISASADALSASVIEGKTDEPRYLPHGTQQHL